MRQVLKNVGVGEGERSKILPNSATTSSPSSPRSCARARAHTYIRRRHGRCSLVINYAGRILSRASDGCHRNHMPDRGSLCQGPTGSRGLVRRPSSPLPHSPPLGPAVAGLDAQDGALEVQCRALAAGTQDGTTRGSGWSEPPPFPRATTKSSKSLKLMPLCS
ncbi:hypothetical protein GQ53DRAFT_305467 [Thozetella sp. PMI_491]|nr:hypothetical protein GQ53DRAFT_305467 [Thozetella sp. PMI_491]